MAQMTTAQWNTVYGIATSNGIDSATIYAIIMNESGGDTNARLLTSQEDSRGIFQVNTYAHPDANSTKLYDPEYSATYWIPQLAIAYKAGKASGVSGMALAEYTEKNGERPQWTATVKARIDEFYTDYQTGKGVTSTSTGSVSSSTSSSSSSSTDPITSAINSAVTSIEGVMIKIIIYVVILVLVAFSFYHVFKINNQENGGGASGTD